MLRFCLIVTVILSSFSISAQVNMNDTQLVIKTIENYFNGYIERDNYKLNMAFDTQNGTMKVPVKTQSGEVSFENNYFKDIIPKWSNGEKLSAAVLNNCSLKILSLDIVEGVMGIAKIEMKVDNTVYLDVLSLQKLNREWKITNKMYVVLK